MKPSFAILLLLVSLLPALAEPLPAPLLNGELPTLAGDGAGAIRDHLSPDGPLVLILWNSECPECMENVAQAAGADLAAHDARLLGVCFDASRWDCLAFTRERGIRWPQLHDPDGLVAAHLGAEGVSFAFAVLDGAGEVLAIQYDSVPDAAETIDQALTAIALSARAGGAPRIERTSLIAGEREPGARSLMGQVVNTRYPQLAFSGDARVKQLAVGIRDDIVPSSEGNDCRCELGGPYGESLREMSEQVYRLTLRLDARLADGVRAGGFLQVGNEDPALLEQGPRYLASEHGSAYVEARRGEWSGRLGYYDLHLTPLTLQRWDDADNPPAAGSGGSCGVCSGSSRAVSLESLDDLGPDLTLEGARLEGAPFAWVLLSGFYARLTSPGAWDQNDAAAFRYRRDLFGASARLKSGARSWGKASLGLHHVHAGDDRGSSSWPTFLSPTDPAAISLQNTVSSASLAATLSWGTEVGAEYARSFLRWDPQSHERGEGHVGEAWLVEVAHEIANGPRVAAAWVNVGADFHAAYGALSYTPNTKGARFQVDYVRQRWGAKLFGKRMSRIDGAWTDAYVPERRDVVGGLLNWKATKDLQFDLTASRIHREETGEVSPSCGCGCDCTETAWTISGRCDLARGARIVCEYTRLDATGARDIGEAMADIGSVYVVMAF